MFDANPWQHEQIQNDISFLFSVERRRMELFLALTDVSVWLTTKEHSFIVKVKSE